ncbi:MAG: NAD(P)/FAD-dependent oxidoreductase [Proteobacteria bacterium]|nr:NAD(P)/FAD-dependent oxidoreductase [Pseudomonadota bacterium]MBI3498224.1 NAD(P)/FAD-dependent oxidoreductase [Pseudomonadota bacterium]
MAERYDAVIIGAGHNGLTCGAYLAKAGLRTLVLERRHLIGGAAVTEEVVSGFRWSVASYVMSLLSPRIIRELELPRFGLSVLPANDLFCPLEDGGHIFFHDDVKKTQAEFARFSRHDAEIYPAFNAYLLESTRIVRRLLYETPIDPTRRDWKTFRDLAQLLWRYRDVHGKLYRIVDLMTQSVYDYLSRWFESDVTKAVLAYYASIGTFAGPKSPGTAYVLMHHLMGEHEGAGGWGFVKGGMGAISNAIADSGRRFGLEVRTEAPVAQVRVREGRATGVVLASGEEIEAGIVASNAHCKLLFLKLVDRSLLPAEFVAEIESFRTFSTAFKINVACERPPNYRAFDRAKAGFDYPTYVHLGPSIDYLEKAYDDAKYGWYSERPFVTPVVPTIVDDSLAPPGKHVVNLFGGHAPYSLSGGDWGNERGRFVDKVMGVIDGFAPGFSSGIIDMQVLLPPDLEELLALPQGHIFHGELSADQLFFQRPVPHYADYRSPIAGLYQCGSSTHPGGGVSGIPGYNAAREILIDLKR